MGYANSWSSIRSPLTFAVSRWILLVLFIPVLACASAPKPQALHRDIKAGNLADLRKHIAQGSSLQERDRYGQTPLHLALLLKKPDLALEFIRQGADVNARLPDGSTPLVMAIDKDQGDVVDELLKRKARVDSPVSGSNPLFNAVRSNNRALFEELVRAGAQTNRADADG